VQISPILIVSDKIIPLDFEAISENTPLAMNLACAASPYPNDMICTYEMSRRLCGKRKAKKVNDRKIIEE
jgi:hypothetical protein